MAAAGLTHAQTDTEFWFVAPEITSGHCNGATCPGGTPVFFRVSALELDAEVRIYQPANLAGLDTTFTVPALTTVSINATNWIDDLENKPGGIVLNKGIHITSTNLITVYYDEDQYWNQDIFALKGNNALGMEFYTPFNSQWRNGVYNPLPYSSIDIVATEDNTVITVTPTANIVGHPAGVPFSITLNRGETYSCLATSQMAAGHLGGTHITSTKPIAVTLKDDSVWAQPQGCKDLIGDQTVPIVNAEGKRIVGYEYIVMRGKINLINPSASPPDPDGVPTGERIFIMATEPNTEVYIDGVLMATINNPGEQFVYEIRNNSTHVEGDKPIMVLHSSGFGCELGGAVLPTIDGCTGSVEVSFTRSTNRDFYLNIMTYDAAKNGFTMHYEDGSTFPIPGTWFEPVGSTDFVCLKKNNKYFANNRAGGVPQGEVVKITNSISVFHLGLIEGGRTTGCKYGYFSDYSESRGGVLVVETGSKSVFRCFGDTIQLRANGGIDYSWLPTDFLDDPYSATPISTPPPGVHNYDVTITRGCWGDTTITVIVGIADEVESYFESDEWYICAPDTVSFDNLSFGVDLSSVSNTQWDFDLEDPGNPFVYDTSSVVQHVFTNTSDTIEKKTVQLVVWNSQSCVSEFRRDILIRPEINASFTQDIDEGCHPVSVDFTNSSTGNTDRYKWTLGDGGSANTADVSHTYINYGMADSLYHVEMVAISPFYCSDTAYSDVAVYPYIEADFAIDTFQGCSPLVIHIDNNSAGYIEAFEWSFGDGDSATSSAGSLTHTYRNTTLAPVTYPLRLVVKNEARGCTDTIVRMVTVFPQVTAGFTQDTTSVCHATELGFYNQSTPAATMFEWDFGDGGSSSSEDPLHTFENTTPGNVDYLVRLVSTTDYMCRDTAYETIRTHPYIHAEYAVNEFHGCAPFLLQVQNSSVGAISSYRWDWGDGSPPSTVGDSIQTHLYQNSGPAAIIRPLQLVVENSDGCTDTMTRNITVFPEVQSQFIQDQTAGCNQLEVAFTNQSSASATSLIWEFGDGGSSLEETPVHLFENFGLNDTTYTTRLIAMTDENCSDTSEVDITVFSYVSAEFTFTNSPVCTPFDVELTNGSVGGTSFHWDFGDGHDTTVSNADPVVHRFTNSSLTDPVTYEIVLTVTNAQNCNSVQRKEITVLPVVDAAFSVDVDQGCHPLSVEFTNESSGSILYTWDFDNGQSSDDPHPTMTFENFSSADTVYQVRLVATNVYTCQDSFFVPIVVHPYVMADFHFQEYDKCPPSTLPLNNASIGGTSYHWDFDDGTDTTTLDPVTVSHTFNQTDYENIGLFQVTLTAENAAGCSSEAVRVVEVYPAIEALYSMSMDEGCHPMQVAFDNLSNGAYTYEWDFGDGASSDAEELTHSFTNYGDDPITRQIRLRTTSRFNCVSEYTSQVTIHPKPTARFETPDIIDCPPFDVTILNTSLNADRYAWNLGNDTLFTTTSRNPMSHAFDNATNDILSYELSLTATSDFGCTDSVRDQIHVFPATIARFTVNDGDCSPFTAHFINQSLRGETYQWEFGDGSVASTTDPTNLYFNHTGEDTRYMATLTSISRYGCTDTATTWIDVYAQPDVEFLASPTIQMFPATQVDFANLTPGGSWTYLWDMGDGTQTSQVDPPAHDYGTWGDYTVWLQASTPYCSDSIAHTIRILPATPVALFDTVIPGCEPHTVQFRNNSLYGETYLWEFGDGGTSTEFEPEHTYQEYGIYNVKLTVSSAGGTEFAYRQVEVYRMPVVDFRVAPELVMLPDDEIKLFNLTQFGNTYLWDFGDGNTSVEENPRHLYQTIGEYDISLEVTTQEGCTDRLIKNALVTVEGEGYLYFPNAFRPDLTGPNGGYYDLNEPEKNNIFHPFWEGVLEYHLEIYTRWGEKLFYSNDVNIGWDGYVDGTLGAQGVYIYKSWGIFINGRTFEEKGDVTLLYHNR